MTELTPATETIITNETLLTLFRRVVKFMVRAHHSHGHAQHAQAHVLAVLKENNPMNQHDLMERLDVRSASLSELLAKLERGGFITRDRDEADKRNYVISVTEQGCATVSDHEKEHKKNADAIFASLSETERRQLGGILNKLISTLEKDPSAHEVCHEHHGQHCGHRHSHHGHHTHGHLEHNEGSEHDGYEGHHEHHEGQEHDGYHHHDRPERSDDQDTSGHRHHDVS
jgi:DNA-binding MarR family transcriptional regulator